MGTDGRRYSPPRSRWPTAAAVPDRSPPRRSQRRGPGREDGIVVDRERRGWRGPPPSPVDYGYYDAGGDALEEVSDILSARQPTG